MAQTFITSRRSKVLHVHFPTQPSKPLVVSTTPVNNGVATAVVQFNFNGDMRNIYGFELRTADNYTVIYQRPVASYADLFVDLAANTPLPYLVAPGTLVTLIGYFFNQAWSYSDPCWVDVVVPSVNTTASVISNSATFAIPSVVIGSDPCPHFIVLDQGGTITTASAQCSNWGSDVITPLFIHVAKSDSTGAVWTDAFTNSPGITIPGGSAAVETAKTDAVLVSKADQIKVIIFPGSNTTCTNISVNVGWQST
jgi:hypothetical protein